MQKKKRIDTIKENTGSSELDIRLKDFWRDNAHFADLVNAAVIALITGSELLRRQTEKEVTVDMCKALEDFERHAAEQGAWNKVISQVAIKLKKGKSSEQIADELEESLPVIEKAILELQQGQVAL